MPDIENKKLRDETSIIEYFVENLETGEEQVEEDIWPATEFFLAVSQEMNKQTNLQNKELGAHSKTTLHP